MNQLNHLRHLLDLKDWSVKDYDTIFKTADEIRENKVSIKHTNIKIANLFFENSTRTSISFEIAALSLGMLVLNFSVLTSSQNKGETLLDTIDNLCAMGIGIFVLRHPKSGTPHFIANNCRYPIKMINAGDGEHSHPSQALIDCYTIRKIKGKVKGLTIAICGDIIHSRVARSLIQSLSTLGAKKIILCAPLFLLPNFDLSNYNFLCEMTTNIDDAVKHADVIIGLRIQNERFNGSNATSSEEYSKQYRIDKSILPKIKQSAIIMHPGPVVWGIEIGEEISNDSRNKILSQVANSTAVRMAIIHTVINSG